MFGKDWKDKRKTTAKKNIIITQKKRVITKNNPTNNMTHMDTTNINKKRK